MIRSYVFPLFLILISCSVNEDGTADPIFCTEELRPGLEITVKDAKSNEILTEGIKVIAIDTSGTENLINFTNSNTFVGAFEKAGKFLVAVEGEKHQRFVSQDSITVDKDACHVITEKREVLLDPVR